MVDRSLIRLGSRDDDRDVWSSPRAHLVAALIALPVALLFVAIGVGVAATTAGTHDEQAVLQQDAACATRTDANGDRRTRCEAVVEVAGGDRVRVEVGSGDQAGDRTTVVVDDDGEIVLGGSRRTNLASGVGFAAVGVGLIGFAGWKLRRWRAAA